MWNQRKGIIGKQLNLSRLIHTALASSSAFNGRHYSIRKYPVSQGMVPSWNQEAFAVLSNLFQMTVADLTKYPTPAIAIAK